jgi:hypothetical protein
MNESDPVKRFGMDQFVDVKPEEEVDNYVLKTDDEETTDYRFKSFMYKNDFEHLVVRWEKKTET